jgi:hypothetical protein
MSNKVKIVKKNLAPAAKPLGVNPSDPWSTKAGITEASEKELLHRFLDSRGINPEFVSKETKIAHSKSGEYLKWKRDHEFEEQVSISPTLKHHKALERRAKMLGNVGAATSKYRMHEATDKEDVLSFDIPLFIRILELAREDVKEDMELHRITERLLSIRKKGVLTMDDYEFIAGLKKLKEEMLEEGVFTDDESIAKHLVKKYGKNVDSHQIRLAHHFHPEKHKTTPERIANHVNRLLGKPVTEESIDEGVFTDDESIAKHLVKKHGKDVRPSDIKLAMHFHPEPHKTSLERIAGHVKRLVSGPKPVTEGKSPRLTSLDKFRKAAAEREKKHNEIEKKMKARHAAGKEDMRGSIDRLEKHLNKEENELNEMDQKFIDSLNKLSQTHKVGDSVTVNSKFFGKQKGKVTKIDKQSVHVVRDGKSSAEKYPHDAVVKEDVYQDPQAATQTVFDGGNNTDDTTTNRKREMSKSARMIKALYKKHRMVKEDMYDHEKEDKSVQTYGKKPKTLKTDEKSSMSENKPNAAAIVSGGTTLTGEKRDDVEIDPMMKNRPTGQNQFNKEFGKKGS